METAFGNRSSTSDSRGLTREKQSERQESVSEEWERKEAMIMHLLKSPVELEIRRERKAEEDPLMKTVII